jgi:histidinol dehydrogenase
VFGLSLKSKDKDFKENFYSFLQNKNSLNNSVKDDVHQIIESVRNEGDQAVIEATNKFDDRRVLAVDDLEISEDIIASSLDRVDKKIVDAMFYSFERVLDFHKDQLSGIHLNSSKGPIGRRSRSLKRVAMYVPGGKASYPSTVLMAAGPAISAGVDELFLTTPWPHGSVNDLTLAAAYVAGIKNVHSIGGAQAIAAFALGTESIPKVQKIIGPGNQFVAEAKRQLYGEVGIDSIAGPSELTVLADSHSDPITVSWDLMAQAEHDEMASSVLVSTSEEFITEVKSLIKKEVPLLSRSSIIKKSLRERGAAILAEDTEHAISLVNQIAPEHVHVVTKDALKDSRSIINAGLILSGSDSANALSDYVLGPSHILPTSGSSVFNSPLSVEDFIVHSSFINLDESSKLDEYDELVKNTSILARAEGLTAHAISAEIRKKKD